MCGDTNECPSCYCTKLLSSLSHFETKVLGSCPKKSQMRHDYLKWGSSYSLLSSSKAFFPSALLDSYKKKSFIFSYFHSEFHPIFKWVQHWWCKWVYLFHKNQNVITQPWLFLLCVLWKLRIVQLKSAMNSQLFFFPFDVSYLLLGYM